MTGSFWLSGAGYAAYIGAAATLAAALLSRDTRRRLSELEVRKASYRDIARQIWQVSPELIFSDSASEQVMMLIDKYRETCSHGDAVNVIREMQREVAEGDEAYEKRRQAVARFWGACLAFLAGVGIVFAVVSIATAAIVTFIPNSAPGKWIRHLFSHSTSHRARPYVSLTPLATPSWPPTPTSRPSAIPALAQTASANATTAPPESTSSSSPDVGTTPVADRGALLSPSCGSGDKISCVSKVASRVITTCVADPTQSISSSNLAGLIPSAVGSVTKCAGGAVSAVVPAATPSPVATATASSLSLP